jgi:hypothetical protein
MQFLPLPYLGPAFQILIPFVILSCVVPNRRAVIRRQW